MKPMSAEITAGVIAGIAGLLVFLIIHHFWILPIWFILPPGLLIAGLGGAAAGWSYIELSAGLPPRPWTVLAIIALYALMLAPAMVLPQFREPLIDMATFNIKVGQGGRAVMTFVLELLLPAGIIGALAGWLIGRTPQAALATALAGMMIALGPGHNIPFLPTQETATKGAVLLFASLITSCVVMVEAAEWLKRF
jgi:hypothetical protein